MNKLNHNIYIDQKYITIGHVKETFEYGDNTLSTPEWNKRWTGNI